MEESRLETLPGQQPATLYGRDEDLRRAEECLLRPDVRLLTLSGPPGAGKTRLALALAQRVEKRFRDGVSVVDLSPVGDADLVAGAIAQQIGLRDSGGARPRELLRDFLRDQQKLLVLDNFEQILEAAPLLSYLVASCPDLRVVVTSRSLLNLSIEHPFEVPPLAVPDLDRSYSQDALRRIPSVALFLARAQAGRPDEAWSEDDLSAAAEICVRLDGLPLALELAAARCRLLTPQSLLRRLERRLDLLTRRQKDTPARHQTLRGAIGWSYSLLSPAEQAVFRRLAVFAAGCRLEDAEAVCGHGASDDTVLESIQSLAVSNLVLSGTGPAGSTRLRMLETIREYARECLDKSSELEAISRRHAYHFLALAQEASLQLEGPHQARWQDVLEAEHANLLAALRWFIQSGVAQRAVEMVGVLWRFWWRRGHLTEGRQYTAQVLNMAGLAGNSRSGHLPCSPAACLPSGRRPIKRRGPLLSECVAIAREWQDTRSLAYGLVFLGRVARDLGEADAIGLGTEGVALMREVDDKGGLALALHFLGLSTAHHDPNLARMYFEECLGLYTELGARADLATPLRGLGLVYYLEGDYDEARKLFERSAALLEGAGDQWRSSMVMHDLGSVAAAQGSVFEASAFLAESMRNWQRLRQKRGTLICLAGLARVAMKIGRIQQAVVIGAAVGRIVEAEGIVFEPTDGGSIAAELQPLRDKLGAWVYDSAWREGRTLSMEAAVAAGLRVEEAVKKLRDAAPPRRSGDTLSRLSPREREVAALLPQGLTNRQIAERLTITEGTANLHVKHILAKLGFATRSQAAAWAVRQGLAPAETD